MEVKALMVQATLHSVVKELSQLKGLTMQRYLEELIMEDKVKYNEQIKMLREMRANAKNIQTAKA